ncbi:hypothetical protein HPB50_009671 [Hyalomma asiaticum]|uniref:Uncharacterized protein n=1 Tax=Hyalomma asiaticum TaxID=266040 RepID=A0ACB7RKF7_HYAAI|nr:hypothetical protein HPB50_009671 [Hyalomma asiaticum]
MASGKVGNEKSALARSRGDSDDQRETNSLPEDSAASSSRGEAGVDVQHRRPATDGGAGTSRGQQHTSSKRSRGWDACCCSATKRVKLEEYLPASQVIDHELRDRYEVKLSSFSARTTFRHVAGICKGAVQIRVGHNGRLLAWAFARYASEEEAQNAAKALQGTVLEGSRIKVSYCGDKWNDPTRRPQYLLDTLDVQRLPRKCRTAERVGAVFPTGQVLMVTNTGHARVKFPSTEALVEAVKKQECQVVEGEKLKFAMAVVGRPTGRKKEDDGESAGKA